MVHYTVLVPQRDAGEAFARQLAELEQVLAQTNAPYEIVCIDDGSDRHNVTCLERLLESHERLRILRFDERRGVSAALTAGIAAARGDIVIAVAPGNQYPAQQIPALVSRLARGDLVFGRPRCSGLTKAWRRVARIPRWLFLGLEVRNPDCLFWAARHEAIEGLSLARGMLRYLPTMVAMRGYRVSEEPVDVAAGGDGTCYEWPNPLDLLAVWWLRVRYRASGVRELRANQTAEPHLNIGIYRTATSKDMPMEKFG